MSHSTGISTPGTITFTTIALIAFAANSVLCRKALGGHEIDAASFTLVRLLTGAVVLSLILALNNAKAMNDSKLRSNAKGSNVRGSNAKGSWSACLMLFLYAVTFSYSYNTLNTGTGALLLFGSAQLTMIAFTLVTGTRLHISEWLGVVIAFIGFVYLIMPAISIPSFSGFILMTVAGIAWGIYTLKGRGSQTPLTDTTWNFIRTLPLLMLLVIPMLLHSHVSTNGILLAALSGGLASGVGYAIWYLALGGLNTTQAAVVQLSVPVIAAAGGVIFVAEPITTRLMLSTLMVLGGMLLVVLGRYALQRGRAFGKTSKG